MNTDPYAKSAKKYDIFIERFVTSLRQTGIQVYPPQEGMLVLDVGCGTGTNLNLYHEAGCKVFGIDASPAMLEEAKNKLGDRAELRLGSALEMCYPDEFFDLVIGTLTLHEMRQETRSQVINEMVRVLKKKGRILLIDYHSGSIRFPEGWVYKALIYLIEIAAGRAHFRNFRNFLVSNGIPGLIKSLKLTIEKTKIVGGGNLGVYLLCAEKI